jgi:membrane protein YdbS with pleckstrin-like domain
MMAESDRQTERAAKWVYEGVWRVLSDWFRVPQHPPNLPCDPGKRPDAFKPAAGFLRYLKLWFWIVAILFDVLLLIAWVVLTVAIWWVGLLLLVPAVVLAIFPGIVIYVALHLRYDTTWYVMNDRSLRIRRGIWVISEMTLTFENVQNVTVQQGPIQRMFGISDLIVETAGSGGPTAEGHQATGMNSGVIEGVADAWAIRDRVLAKLQASQTAGIGDEHAESETESGPARGWTPQHVQVLRAIRDELADTA